MSEVRRRVAGIALLIGLYLLIVYLVPKPEAVSPAGWRIFGLFVASVAGLVLEPVPGGAVVLIAVTLTPILGGLTLAQALSGYADSTVWLVMAAFFISRALINTGLARRIALLFVRRFGTSSLGVCYALSMSEMVLATIIPSSGARAGGVVLPIVRSIAELYGSRPGTTARLLGAFLIITVYECVAISCAMFFTGQASNPLVAKMAAPTGFRVTWASWFMAGIIPGLCSIALTPLLVLKLYPPEIRRTPEAAEFASKELATMGPLSSKEWILAVVFAGVCGMWITSDWHGVDITLTALLGSVSLLLANVLSWEDVKSERAGWDIFVWYGGLLMLGKALNDTKVPAEFANGIAGAFGSLGWPLLFAVALAIYFYSHYAFASITAHVLAMYPPFLAILLAKQAPVGLIVFAFACFANLSAGLTNYGTTPAPMFFAHEYVPLRDWWRIGFVVSLLNIAIWSTIGFGWWKLLGIW
ncbi:MAG TPA: DASS family sodium-coupled anion symporter [Bryobacteraceae bacterium]|nr:DASS family sodium-coupled anion symporter [Bryobacteraceae bacterium]